MVIIKIGGSLKSSKYIKLWINSIKQRRDTSFLLIFGGGKYANNVRKEQSRIKYNDYVAHKLAIDSMRKFTNEVLKDIEDFTVVDSIQNINKMHSKRKLLVWMPTVNEIDSFNIPANWDATSDTISLAVAKILNCPLLIIKSVKFNKKEFLNTFFLKENLLDKYFTENHRSFTQLISIASREKFYKLKKICKDFNQISS